MPKRRFHHFNANVRVMNLSETSEAKPDAHKGLDILFHRPTFDAIRMTAITSPDPWTAALGFKVI